MKEKVYGFRTRPYFCQDCGKVLSPKRSDGYSMGKGFSLYSDLFLCKCGSVFTRRFILTKITSLDMRKFEAIKKIKKEM